MVLLTRGKDKGLLDRLRALGIEAAEVALLEQVDLPGLEVLPGRLLQADWVAVTSKEGAKRLLWAWEKAGRPLLKVAAVGEKLPPGPWPWPGEGQRQGIGPPGAAPP
ncbi:uroporphyrinogen-III synthase, partial [Thermus scotoductus]|uniref:uroporphyrinogen-III synthase n=1 Tax=Thermus scotoductus TaxID=37636 RepID=UPI003453AA92